MLRTTLAARATTAGARVLGLTHAVHRWAIQQALALLVDDAQALALRRYGQLKHHIKAADKGRIQRPAV